jgi:hypothetical protein
VPRLDRQLREAAHALGQNACEGKRDLCFSGQPALRGSGFVLLQDSDLR